MTQHPQQQPPHPPEGPYPAPPVYYVKKGPSAGKVILWIFGILIILTLLLILFVVVVLQLT